MLVYRSICIKLLLDQGINQNEDLPQLIGNLGGLLFCLSRNLSISFSYKIRHVQLTALTLFVYMQYVCQAIQSLDGVN